MAELDYAYITELVIKAQSGDSDAFAELFASTYQKQYMFACSFLSTPYQAQEALLQTYITALKGISSLTSPQLFVSWLNQINFRICYSLSIKEAGLPEEAEKNHPDSIQLGGNAENQIVRVKQHEYVLQQIMALPFSESQAILLRFYKKLSIAQIAFLMEISRGSVKRYLSSGIRRLSKLPAV